MPCFPAALFAALCGSTAAILDGQHLAGFWPTTLAAALDAHLAASDDRSLRAWFDKAAPHVVVLTGLAMPNVNRVADLAALMSRGAIGPVAGEPME